MKQPIKIAAVQMPWDLPAVGWRERIEVNFAEAERWLVMAGEGGADIACLGETFNTVGVSPEPEEVMEWAADAEGAVKERFGPLARKYGMGVIAPVHAVREGKLRNVALVLSETGELLGGYEKVHCTEKERELGVVPGREWPVFTIKGARVGIQICHDNSFPESARCLTLAGAEILFWPHVMGGWGGEFMDVLLKSPAIHNGIHHVPVCFGCPADRAWRPGMLIGRSSIIGPDGTIHADAGRHPGIACATVDLDAPRLAHWFTRPGDFVFRDDMLNDRRPDAYALLTEVRPPRDPVSAPGKRGD